MNNEVMKLILHCTKNTIHQVTTMLATSKKSYFQVIVTLLTPSRAYWWPFTLIITIAGTRTIIKVLGDQYRWLAWWYDMEIGL